MVVVSQAEANRILETDGFLVHTTVLGHVYGITRAALSRAQATGQVRACLGKQFVGAEADDKRLAAPALLVSRLVHPLFEKYLMMLKATHTHFVVVRSSTSVRQLSHV
jgi:hypothetical protein